jgi:hypothetical protein
MLEELERLTVITDLIRLLHLPPAPKKRDIRVFVLEKAYLMQVRLDLESKVEAVSADRARANTRDLSTAS